MHCDPVVENRSGFSRHYKKKFGHYHMGPIAVT